MLLGPDNTLEYNGQVENVVKSVESKYCGKFTLDVLTTDTNGKLWFYAGLAVDGSLRVYGGRHDWEDLKKQGGWSDTHFDRK